MLSAWRTGVALSGCSAGHWRLSSPPLPRRKGALGQGLAAVDLLASNRRLGSKSKRSAVPAIQALAVTGFEPVRQHQVRRIPSRCCLALRRWRPGPEARPPPGVRRGRGQRPVLAGGLQRGLPGGVLCKLPCKPWLSDG